MRPRRAGWLAGLCSLVGVGVAMSLGGLLASYLPEVTSRRRGRLVRSNPTIPRGRSFQLSILTTLAFTGALVFAGPASASTYITPTGISYTVNAMPGADHTDPHIDGNLIAYTTATSTGSSIHYYNLSSGTDATIPNGDGFDFLSAVNAGRIVFSRSVPGTNGGIWLYDTTNAASPGPVSLANQPGSARDSVEIGGNTVVWQDRTINPNAQIVAYSLATGTTTQLSSDPTSENLTPEVSPDGTVITWVSCQPPNDTGCNVYDAVLSNGGWVVHQLTFDGNDSHPDSNGSTVVYASGPSNTNNSHVYIQPVAGGNPQEIASGQPGSQALPSISGNYISYADFDATGSSDIYVAELRNGSPDGNLYQITNTPQPETLNDISATASGRVNVTWQVFENGQYDVYAFSFTPAKPTPQSLCLQTVQDVQGSSKYMALPKWLRGAINGQVGAICGALDAITASLSPPQKSFAIAAYKRAVAQLAVLGWLTGSQASDLSAQADLL